MFENLLRICPIIKAYNQAVDDLEDVASAKWDNLTETFHSQSQSILSSFDESRWSIDIRIVLQALNIIEYHYKHFLMLSSYNVFYGDSFEQMVQSIILAKAFKTINSVEFRNLDAMVKSFMRIIILMHERQIKFETLNTSGNFREAFNLAINKLNKLGLGVITYTNLNNNGREVGFFKDACAFFHYSMEMDALLEQVGLVEIGQ